MTPRLSEQTLSDRLQQLSSWTPRSVPPVTGYERHLRHSSPHPWRVAGCVMPMPRGWPGPGGHAGSPVHYAPAGCRQSRASAGSCCTRHRIRHERDAPCSTAREFPRWSLGHSWATYGHGPTGNGMSAAPRSAVQRGGGAARHARIECHYPTRVGVTHVLAENLQHDLERRGETVGPTASRRRAFAACSGVGPRKRRASRENREQLRARAIHSGWTDRGPFPTVVLDQDVEKPSLVSSQGPLPTSTSSRSSIR